MVNQAPSTPPEAAQHSEGEDTTLEQGNGSKPPFWVVWVFGILGTLLAAGVVANIGVYGKVGRMEENLTLFRQEVRRDFNRHEAAIERLDDKLDAQPRGGGYP